MTIEPINKLGFLCCIYDQTLGEIHQSIEVKPMLADFHNRQQQTTDNGDQNIPATRDNRPLKWGEGGAPASTPPHHHFWSTRNAVKGHLILMQK